MEKSKINKEKLIEKIDKLFDSPYPVEEIHAVLKKMISNGYNRDLIYNYLGEYRLELQRQGKNREEEILVEIFTFFEGLCLDDWKL